MLPALGLDELRVVERLVSRMSAARADYGELDLERDDRDFGAEAADELTDCLFYMAAREVAAQDRRLERLRCEAADENRATIDRALDELRRAEPITAPQGRIDPTTVDERFDVGGKS